MKVLHTEATLLLKRLFKLERCGRYDEAFAELNDIWEDIETLPNVEEFESYIAAEIVLRCGSLIGFLGHNKQIPNSQEKSKNLLTEVRNRFFEVNDVEKIAECENYLALAYWRTGELNEAETYVEESLSHNLPNSSLTRLYSYIIESKIDFANSKYEKILQNFAKLQDDFLKYADNCLKGDFYNHSGLALKNLGNPTEALNRLELARHYHQKAKHQIYLGTDENNLAQLYKLEGRFSKALEAIDNATRIFKQINDRTREGFSFDTKAQIYFAERKYTEALRTIEKAIAILKNGENKAYLVETYLTKAKILIYLEDIFTAHLCLSDAIQTAKTNISEEAAKDLIAEFEKTRKEKNSPVIEKVSTEKETLAENLELLLPSSLAHYKDLQGVWIKNNHLESVGLRKDSLAIVAQEKVKRGDLVAIAEIANDSVSCGFYDADFGIVCLEGANSEAQLFDEKDIRVLGKIVGVCKSEKNPDGKTIVEPLNI